MGSWYVFALVVGLGVLLVQVLLGSKSADAHADADASADADAHGDADAHADAHAAGDAHESAGGKEVALGGGLLTLVLSTRFWIFACLAFGLSGTLLHYLTGVSALATAITAAGAGLGSGLGASAAFRALRRASSAPAPHTAQAVGQVGRVIVPCTRGGTGQVRIEICGQSVDLLAKTGEERLERGDTVVIEEVDGEVAQVSRCPREIED